MYLNRKGYMLVEIIISFTLAMGIAYYLLNLTYKFKNMDEDIYMSAKYMKDKTAITKNIMNDIDRGIVQEDIKLNNDNNEVTFSLILNETEQKEYRKISVTKTNSKYEIKYGKTNEEGGAYDETDVSYYSKEIDNSLVVKEIEMKKSQIDNCFSIKINISSLYDDNNYDIKLFGQIGNQSI